MSLTNSSLAHRSIFRDTDTRMKLLIPDIFTQFSEVVAAMSLRDKSMPADFDMRANQTDNRASFARELGFEPGHIATPQQTHSDTIQTFYDTYTPREGDAIITSERSWLIGVTVADCVPVLLYAPQKHIVGAVHSGWRGSSQNIAGLTVARFRKYEVAPNDIYAWIGPHAGAESYQVGQDVMSEFNQKYTQPHDNGWLFDNGAVVYDQLTTAGVPADQIEVSSLDTITNPELHSDRRDEEESGRMLAAIGCL